MTWHLFVFSNQFDLNLFMVTTENSSMFRLLTKESMLLTSATFLIEEVVKEIPPYFKNQSVPIVSYSYTNSIGRKMFNYKEALQDINIEEYLKNPLTCDCSHSPFQYNPSGHVITGDLNINQHESPKGDFSWF